MYAVFQRIVLLFHFSLSPNFSPFIFLNKILLGCVNLCSLSLTPVVAMLSNNPLEFAFCGLSINVSYLSLYCENIEPELLEQATLSYKPMSNFRLVKAETFIK